EAATIAVEKKSNELREALDQSDQSAARGMLRPLDSGHAGFTTDAEIDILWEIAGWSRDELRLRFVKEALRVPATTRQLTKRADLAVQAATGLDRHRRDQVEQLLRERLRVERLTRDWQLDLTVLLATLGGWDSAEGARDMVGSLKTASDRIVTRAMA